MLLSSGLLKLTRRATCFALALAMLVTAMSVLPGEARADDSIFTSSPITHGQEGMPYEYTVTTAVNVTSWGLVSAIVNPAGDPFNARSFRVVASPEIGDAGSYPVSIKAEVGGIWHWQNYTLTVAPGDIFDSEPATTVVEGHPYVYQVATIIPGCTYELTLGPSWLSIDPSTGLLAGTPPAGSSNLGSYPIEITATTPEAVECVQFWLLVVLPDVAIAITSEPVLNATANITYEYQVTCRYTVIEWNLTGPEWLSIDEHGLISGTAPNGTQGSFPISVRLTMIAGVQAWQNYTLEVERQPYTAEDGMAMAFGMLAFMIIVSAVVGIVAQSRRRF